MLDSMKVEIPLFDGDYELVFGSNKKFRQPRDPRTSKKITLRPNRARTGIIVETSAARLLQGHNICGTNKMHRLCYLLARHIHKLLGLKKTAEKVSKLQKHDYNIMRADVTGWFNVGSQANVISGMTELELQLLAQGAKLEVHKDRVSVETIYIGKHSRHATLKFYNKYRELKHTGLPDSLSDDEKDTILEAAKPLIRVELTLRMPALKSKKVDADTEYGALRQSSGWSVEIARQLLETELARYQFNGQIRDHLDPKEIEGMKANDRTFYLLHQRGNNLGQVMNKRTFSTWRKKLLQRYQIDIGRPIDCPPTNLLLADLLAPSKLLMNWPKKLRKLGLVAGTEEWKRK